MLVALSIDRWEAVVKPLAFTRNRSRGYYLVAGAWILAFICAMPVTLYTKIKEFGNLPQCWIELSSIGWKVYMLYLTCSLLIIPALIIAICYTHIVYTIWSKGQLNNTTKQQAKNNNKRKIKSESVSNDNEQQKRIFKLQNSNSDDKSNITGKANNVCASEINLPIDKLSHTDNNIPDCGSTYPTNQCADLNTIEQTSQDHNRIPIGRFFFLD